jgi:hypothetical protein
VPVPRGVRFLQDNRDRRQIFAVVTEGGSALGFGPLALDAIYAGLYTEPYPSPWHPRGDPALGDRLTAHGGDLHDLRDFYRFYGYPPQLVSWVEATPPEGRDETEVAARLGVDPQRLHRAAMREAVIPGAQDPAGDPVYQDGFADNWAVANPAGQVSVNPDGYRFKAWLSLES